MKKTEYTQEVGVASVVPDRYAKICITCPAWFSCKDHEGLAHTCPECFKSFYLNTQKQGMQRRHSDIRSTGAILPDSWRFIDGIPEACPLLTDEFIRYEHPCLECMKKAGIKVIENETINENKP